MVHLRSGRAEPDVISRMSGYSTTDISARISAPKTRHLDIGKHNRDPRMFPQLRYRMYGATPVQSVS
jgi:hypothetical protein